MESNLFVILLLVKLVLVNASHVHLDWDTRNPALDQRLYDEVLDPEKCQTQLAYLTRNNTLLRLEFMDAGLRFPRSVLMWNTLDLGNYHQCLRINHELEDMHIDGKYCNIHALVSLNSGIIDFNGIQFDPNELRMDVDTAKRLGEYEATMRSARKMTGVPDSILRSPGGDIVTGFLFTLSVCIPKPCTIQEGISGLYFNFAALGLQFEDGDCRLRNDKPWVPADYVAIVIFSIIGLLTLLSTGYDVWHSCILKKDTKEAGIIGKSFSVYTNARRLTTFTKEPGSLECLDGIRTLAMAWVIVGHTFFTLPPQINLFDTFEWIQSLSSLWITSAFITVDTFFLLSGLLLVYTTTGKLTSKLFNPVYVMIDMIRSGKPADSPPDVKLLKNLHIFYLNRILRMWPLLATAVLLQASIFNRIADGPQWATQVGANTNACRTFWWTTLLYIENYINPTNVCHGHLWYLAIDMQLYIISPIILVWVLSGKSKVAWSALIAGLLVCLTAATTYVFIMELPGSSIVPTRLPELVDYQLYFYINTLTRASPFFVGMVFGYLLHQWHGKRMTMPITLVLALWVTAFIIMAGVIYVTYPMLFLTYDNQLLDSFVNAFQRPLWAMCLGWIIVACVHGYGGPINWFLSLSIWKLPSRISYGMYLFHYPIQFIIAGTAVAPIFFTEMYAIYNFLAQFVLAFVVAFVLTLLIDSPFSTLVKLFMGPKPKHTGNEESKAVNESTALSAELPTSKHQTNENACNDTDTHVEQEPLRENDENKINSVDKGLDGISNKAFNGNEIDSERKGLNRNS